MTKDFDVDAVVREVTDTLGKKYPGIDGATVEAIVREQVEALAERPVRDYVAVLAQREAKRRLKELDGA